MVLYMYNIKVLSAEGIQFCFCMFLDIIVSTNKEATIAALNKSDIKGKCQNDIICRSRVGRD